MTTALGMAAAGLGVAILPEAAIASGSDGLELGPIRRPVLTRPIGIITREDRSLSPAARTLVEVLERSTRGATGGPTGVRPCAEGFCKTWPQAA
jgi:LysR family transcriptional regulator, carnitine catabolism transcriptional activator